MVKTNVNFEDVVYFQEGPGVRNWQFRDSGIKLINIRNLVDSELCLENTNNYLEIDEVENKYKHFLLNAGDFVMASSGVTWGKIAEVHEEHLPLCLNTSIIRLVSRNTEVLDKWYLYYYIKSPQFRRQIEKLITGSAQPNFGPSHLKKVSISLPDINNQRESVVQFTKLEKIISKRQEELKCLDDLIKARFVELMDSSELGDETTVEEITERVKVGFVGTCEKYYTDESGIPMLRTGNITEKGIDLKDLKYVTEEFHDKNKKSQIHEGDLLIARHGSNGQANVYSGPEAQCLNAVVIVPNQEIASSFFLAGLINSPMVKTQIDKTLVGSTQHVVNTKSIASLKVRIPSLLVQKQYEDFVKQVDKSKFIHINTHKGVKQNGN